MFDRRRDDAAPIAHGLGDTSDGEIVRLGTARREDDLVGIASKECGYLLACAVHSRSCAVARDVVARRISVVTCEVRQHCVEYFGQQWRGSVVVEVDR